MRRGLPTGGPRFALLGAVPDAGRTVAGMATVFTIGHSTHPIDEFIDLLRRNGVERVVDVRTVPRSRHNPQFEHTALERSLPAAGIEYVQLPALGGLRPKAAHSTSTAWRNASFRNYADYLRTPEFEAGLDALVELAGERPTAIMCAEAVPWRCHRSLIGDALLARGHEVLDIMSPSSTQPHTLTSFAVLDGERVTYPGE